MRSTDCKVFLEVIDVSSPTLLIKIMMLEIYSDGLVLP
jgi:hypothetical protein